MRKNYTENYLLNHATKKKECRTSMSIQSFPISFNIRDCLAAIQRGNYKPFPYLHICLIIKAIQCVVTQACYHTNSTWNLICYLKESAGTN